MAKLNQKQTLFAQEYCVDLNATQAAIRAGYSEKTAGSMGHELLKKPEIQTLIRKLMAKRSRRVEITQDSVLEALSEVASRCLQREPVMVGTGDNRHQKTELVEVEDPETGEVTEQILGVWKFDAHGANGALKLIGQHMAMFTKNVNQNINLPKAARIQLVKPSQKPSGD